MIPRIFLSLLLFIVFYAPVFGQKQVQTQSLLWTRYSVKIELNERYKLRQEFDERTYWFPWRQHQALSRTFAERNLGNGWSVGLGFTYFRQSFPHDPTTEDYYTLDELRPQLELSYTQKVSEKFKVSHRYWSEFRVFEQAEGGFEYSHNRSRYKLEGQYSLAPSLTLIAFDELHLNIGRSIVANVFDQNRYGASLRYNLNRNFGLESGYINWFQQRASGIDFYNRHIVRFTLHHAIYAAPKAG